MLSTIWGVLMASYLRPLALGLIQVPEGSWETATRSQARIALALRANKEGYALVETLEVGVNGLKDNAQFATLEELAVRLDAEALLVSGEVDEERVEEMAGRLRLVVVPAESARRPPRNTLATATSDQVHPPTPSAGSRVLPT
jgi:hypothetical protein